MKDSYSAFYSVKEIIIASLKVTFLLLMLSANYKSFTNPGKIFCTAPHLLKQTLVSISLLDGHKKSFLTRYSLAINNGFTRRIQNEEDFGSMQISFEHLLLQCNTTVSNCLI